MKDATPIILQGTVTRFKGNGRKLGYPTANITTATDARDGVYFGFADLNGFAKRPSLIFIGVPTTMGDTERRVEIHLLDIPDEDYYDQPLSVELRHYHRPNRTFKDMKKLMEVMEDDEAVARAWFGSHSA